MSVLAEPRLTELANAARLLREATRDKTYQASPLGIEVALYLRYMQYQRDATPSTLRDYEACLAKLALEHADLELKDLEPPVGTQRLEEFLYHNWADRETRTFAKQISILVSFGDWAVKRQKLYANPARGLDRPKQRRKVSDLFSPAFRDRVLNAQATDEDRLACRLILMYGLRQGELRSVQLKHFDFERRRLKVFGKGRKEREIPILDDATWNELGRLHAFQGLGPDSYLLYARQTVARVRVPVAEATETLRLHDGTVLGYVRRERRNHDRRVGPSAAHRWWYRCLVEAGVVEPGTTSGEHMHKGRHTAITEFLRSEKGNLKLAQLLAGHSSIRTTADIYDHRDIGDLAAAMTDYLDEG